MSEYLKKITTPEGKEIKVYTPVDVVVDTIGKLYALSHDLPVGSKATVYFQGAELNPTEVKGVTEKDIEDYSMFIGNGGNAEDYKWDYDNIVNLQLRDSNLPTLNSDSNCAFTVYFMTPDDLMAGEENIKYASVTIEGKNVYGAIFDSTIPTEEEQNWEKAICTNGSWNYNVILEFNDKVKSLNATVGMLIDDGADLSILDGFVSLTSDKEVYTDYRLLKDGWVEDSTNIDTTAIDAKIQENTDKIEALQTDVDNSISSFQHTINSVTSNIASINSSVRQNTSNISNNTDNIAELTAKVEENSEYIKTHKDEYYWLNKSVVGVFDELEEVKAKVDDFLPADYLIQMAQADGRLMCERYSDDDGVLSELDWWYSDEKKLSYGSKDTRKYIITHPLDIDYTLDDRYLYRWSQANTEFSKIYSMPNMSNCLIMLPEGSTSDSSMQSLNSLFINQTQLSYISPHLFDSQANSIVAIPQFGGCEKLEKITLPTSMPKLECLNLLAYFGAWAGYVTTSALKEVTLPKSMPNIKEMIMVFEGCEKLEKINIADDGADGYDTSLNNLITIKRCFYGCTNLTSINDLFNKDLPNLEYAGEAFSLCRKLQSIKLGSMPKLQNALRMFRYCMDLKELILPEELPEVTNAQEMFSTIGSMEGVTFTLNVPKMPKCKTINQMCAYYHIGYGDIHYVNLPEEFPEVTHADTAFCGFKAVSMDSISLPDLPKATDLGSYLFQFQHPTIVGTGDTPKIKTLTKFAYESKITEFLDNSLQNCENVTSITNAFYGCSNLTNLPTGFLGGLKISVSFAQSVNLTRESILNVINAVADLSAEGKTATLTLNATAKARLTADDIAIATAKGWTIA